MKLPRFDNRKNVGAVAPLGGQEILVDSASHLVDDSAALAGSMVETSIKELKMRPVTVRPRMVK